MLDLDLFDQINTTAVQWLVWNAKSQAKPLGIKNFKRKNKNQLWLLYIMTSFSIATNYSDFYLNCSLFDYFYIKFIKKIKHIKRFNNKVDIFLIDSDIFIHEICEHFNQNEEIIKEIYNEYWSK